MENDVSKYWAKAAEQYRQTAYKHDTVQTRYPFYEVRLNLVKEMLKEVPRGKLLDAGCGGGRVTLDMLKAGWDAYGCDLVPEMVGLASENLAAAGYGSERITSCSVSDLSAYPDRHFDVVLSLGVMEYIPLEQEKLAFAEARRVLKDDGLFLVENINNLFDLATFNKFTMRFFSEHLLPLFFSGPEEMGRMEEKLRGLVTNPDLPRPREAFGTTRDEVFTKSEIPLAYGDKVNTYGFRQVDQAFYRFHAVPPLLFAEEPGLEKVSIPFELTYCRHWAANFLASGFISVLRKS
jgi:ubiquinone/menaquinone biosynthesis C-methylase UbiE